MFVLCKDHQFEMHPHTQRLVWGENLKWGLKARWCEKLIMLHMKREEQMKGTLASLSPSKQRRRRAEAEQNHTAAVALGSAPLWNLWRFLEIVKT